MGDESYTLANLLPFFKKSVKFTPPNYRKRGGPAVAYDSSAYSPRGGPLQVSYWNYFVPVSQYFKNGLTKLGFKETSGIESGSLIGFAQYPATLNPDAQIRDSSETSYLQEAIQTTGLQVYQRTLAKKIVFNGKRASGVLVDTAGIAYTLYARKEVILAAGVFRTPQLLMVSGIGSEATLRDLNIPCIANLAGVGQSHQVCCSATVTIFCFSIMYSTLSPNACIRPSFLGILPQTFSRLFPRRPTNSNSVHKGSTRIRYRFSCERDHTASALQQCYLHGCSAKSIHILPIRRPNGSREQLPW